jgi:hypothetical protein
MLEKLINVGLKIFSGILVRGRKCRVVDPDSETLWIRIRIGNPEPDPTARKLRNFCGKIKFLVIFF